MKTLVRTWMLTMLMFAALEGCVSHRSNSDGSLEFDGHVVRLELEGGFWAIDADDGRKFSPLEIPQGFRRDQLKVHVRAVTRPDVMSMRMYGTNIQIIEISVRP